MAGAPEPRDSVPTTAELDRRLREQREDAQQQWGEIKNNRACIARMEGKLDRALDEISAVSGHVQALSREVGSKVDKNGKSNGSHGDRLNSLEAWMNRREGAQSLVQWVLARLLPAAAGAATAVAAVYAL